MWNICEIICNAAEVRPVDSKCRDPEPSQAILTNFRMWKLGGGGGTRARQEVFFSFLL